MSLPIIKKRPSESQLASYVNEVIKTKDLDYDFIRLGQTEEGQILGTLRAVCEDLKVNADRIEFGCGWEPIQEALNAIIEKAGIVEEEVIVKKKLTAPKKKAAVDKKNEK